MSSLASLAAAQISDPDLRAVALHAMTATQLAIEKAIAHSADPDAFPLPADPRSIERIMLSRFTNLAPKLRRNAQDKVLPRLTASLAQRRATYGDLADLPLTTATPIQEQVRQKSLPAALRTAAAGLHARYAPLIEPELAARNRPVRAIRGARVSGDDRLATSHATGGSSTPSGRLVLRLREVECLDDTAEAFKDDIYLAGFAWRFDLAVTKSVISAFKVGDFNTKPEHRKVTYNPPRPFATLPVPADRESEITGGVSFVLAEKDFGGLNGYLTSPATLPDRELVQEVAAAALALTAGLIAGAAGAAVAGAAAGLIAGVLGGLLLGAFYALAVAAVAYLVIDLIPGWLRDEIFPEAFVTIPVTFDGTLPGGVTTSVPLHEDFTAFGGKYRITYDWRVEDVPPSIQPPPRLTPIPLITAAQAQANLDKIDHIVILMLENRSFDHMLGYLALDPANAGTIFGLRPDMANTLTTPNVPHSGETFTVHDLDDPVFITDPPHAFGATLRQIGPNRDMTGFVDDYARVDPDDPGKIMGYYSGRDVPVYDYLVREFALCQQWFSSFPGSTWVNRVITVAGRSFGETDNRHPPIYNVPTFFRHLDARNVVWKVYAHDIATLRALDAEYRTGHGDKFAFVRRFFEDAAAGTLPAVSWIDANFMDIGNLADLDAKDEDEGDRTVEFPTTANDDHPPVDIRHAQTLVLNLVAALTNSPNWNKTLCIITYDEHGGFFDHIPPPPVRRDTGGQPSDEGEQFEHYGVRVPAIVVSPLVPRGGVSPIVFDHTSIIATVLRRFCRDADGAVPSMSQRTDAAAHLGFLLTEAPATAARARAAFQRALPALKARIAARRPRTATPTAIPAARPKILAVRAPVATRPRPTPATPPVPRTDLQRDMLAIKAALREAGLPEDTP